ncbi:uncharacterized protein LOC119323357 [Triticum dicoccoides]|uniref:uncharacterized protein LOC119323357 n=1 Tax=Triticum dicoccoides TaxID=85692 RepID=UPI001890F3CB|nr:uncharacterized protein LOC119323357 [Triticum dicoccoides]
MAPQQESNKDGGAATTPTTEEEEEEEEEDEEEHHRHGERPLLLACEQEQDAGKPLPLPVKRRRRSSSLSRSSRSGEQGWQEEAAGPGGGARSLSFSRLFSSFRMTATTSSSTLDIDELAAAEDGCAEQWQWRSQSKRQHPKPPVCRTQSMPMATISRRLPAHGGKKRVADSSSLRRFRVSLSSVPMPLPESAPPPSSPSPSEEAGEEEEEVGEEEAVCRICMVALLEEEEEGGEAAGDGVLKLECRCKGELALAHRRCALKWFGIKGDPNCDVCGHDVLNLPVTLRRVAAPPPPPPPPLTAGNGNGSTSQEEEQEARERRGLRGVWRHGTVILVTVSMLAYFCFLEQLLVGDHGNAAAALAVSAPFAVVLGTFSALTTAGMASSRRYVWAYSALQFLLVVLFTHLFYRYVRLQAVIAIILSAFAGFGVAICANAVLLQAARWRAATAARRPPPPSSDLDTPQP